MGEVKLTPYCLGREWASGKGPHGGKSDYFTAMEAFGFDFTSPEEIQFAAGADAWFNEMDEYGDDDE